MTGHMTRTTVIINKACEQMQRERSFWTSSWYPTAITILVLIALWIHNITRLSAYYLQPDVVEPLRDLGHDALPDLSEYRTYTEIFIITNLVLGAIIFLSPLIVTGMPHISYMVLRGLVTYVILAFMRTTCYIFTVLPAPALQCDPESPDYDKPESWDDLVFSAKFTRGCGDLIFSGHILFLSLATFSFYHYGKRLPWRKLYVIWLWVLAVMYLTSSMFIAATHNHYTVDVVVAWVVVPPYLYMLNEAFPDERYGE